MDEENIPHLFFCCPIVWSVWCKIYKWLGVSTVIYPEAKGNFSQHLMLIKGSKQVGKVLVMIWIAVIRTIWWVRNNVVFKAGSAEVEKIVDAIQLSLDLAASGNEGFV
jgi:predicted metal-binding transcription factor (methanogenesis marker protein 9)